MLILHVCSRLVLCIASDTLETTPEGKKKEGGKLTKQNREERLQFCAIFFLERFYPLLPLPLPRPLRVPLPLPLPESSLLLTESGT